MDVDELRAGAFNIRHCAACKGPILECMGYVKAGDILEGRSRVRELCGKCVFLWEWNAIGELVPSNEVFLDSVYILDHKDREGCSDLIFDNLDRLLCAGNFNKCDEILRDVDVSCLSAFAMRSFLTITHAAKDKLPSWYLFYLRVRRSMIPLKGRRITEKLISVFL